MKSVMAPLLILLALMPVLHAVAAPNGFDINQSLIPADEIHLGGPPKDGIPAIDNPIFIEATEAGLSADDAVLGIVVNGVAKVYPIAILNWHEIVNDRVGDSALVISFCPLCGTGVAFSAEVNGEVLNFGVSGLLYNSDVLLYDRKTESLWSQLLSKAISGPLKGTRLEMLPLMHTTWAHWQKSHPKTRVLSRETGFRRDYERDPYAGYETQQGLYFPVSKRDPRYHPKERVLGIELNGKFKAYPMAELSKTGAELVDHFQSKKLLIRFDAGSHSAAAYDEDGRLLPAVTAFWFAWYAFHPETAVYTAD